MSLCRFIRDCLTLAVGKELQIEKVVCNNVDGFA
jgi:hypothetical protein